MMTSSLSSIKLFSISDVICKSPTKKPSNDKFYSIQLIACLEPLSHNDDITINSLYRCFVFNSDIVFEIITVLGFAPFCLILGSDAVKAQSNA